MACASLACVEAELPRPDLLLVTLDALPVDALACHGGRADVGRDLCSIADQGSRFVWAFAAADAPAPAAASLLTGEPPSLHRVGAGAAGFLRSEASTLAERLARAGYSTAAFVHQPELNRSRHFDQGFARFDDGAAPSSTLVSSGAHDAVSQAASWLATAPSPFFAWVHIGRGPGGDGAAATKGAAEMLGRLDRDLARLLAVLDARATPPAMLVTSLPGARSERLSTRLAPTATRVALLWRPPRVSGGQGVARVIRTPVSQLDIAPTLLRAAGLAVEPTPLAGNPLPFRERRAGEAGRTLEIEGVGGQALIGEGVYLAIDGHGKAIGVARLPLAGDATPVLGSADRSADLVGRLWTPPPPPPSPLGTQP